MNKILFNVLAAFVIAFWFISTIVILMLPNIFEASRFWFLLSLPGATAWATFWVSFAYHYDKKGAEL